MTMGRDVSAPSTGASDLEEGAAGALRRMMCLTDDIIAAMRPLDSLCTLTMLLTRHEFVLHLANICDEENRIIHYSRVEVMNKPRFTAAETCHYISEMALELRRLAEAAGAVQLSTLLAQVVEQADDFSRKKKPVSGRSTGDERA